MLTSYTNSHCNQEDANSLIAFPADIEGHHVLKGIIKRKCLRCKYHNTYRWPLSMNEQKGVVFWGDKHL